MPAPRLRLHAAALAASVLLAGCTGTGPATSPVPGATSTGGTPGQQATPSASTASHPAPTPTNQGVRTVELGSLEWVDVLRDNARVQLSGGRATSGDFTYELLPDVVWNDANGDGQEDVLALLRRTKGKQVITYAYIWLYDPATRKATQLLDPVADWNACGDSLVEVRPAAATGFEISELLRDHYDYQACGTKPLHPRTRTVVVSDHRLVMVKPFLAYGGICYQTYQTATELTRTVPVRVFPEPTAAVVDQQRVFYVAIPTMNERAWPDGWVQVAWTNDAIKKANAYWGVCGFIWQK